MPAGPGGMANVAEKAPAFEGCDSNDFTGADAG